MLTKFKSGSDDYHHPLWCEETIVRYLPSELRVLTSINPKDNRVTLSILTSSGKVITRQSLYTGSNTYTSKLMVWSKYIVDTTHTLLAIVSPVRSTRVVIKPIDPTNNPLKIIRFIKITTVKMRGGVTLESLNALANIFTNPGELAPSYTGMRVTKVCDVIGRVPYMKIHHVVSPSDNDNGVIWPNGRLVVSENGGVGHVITIGSKKKTFMGQLLVVAACKVPAGVWTYTIGKFNNPVDAVTALRAAHQHSGYLSDWGDKYLYPRN